MKALITATTPYMIRQFLMDDIDLLLNMGCEVHVATNYITFNVMSKGALQELIYTLKEKGVKLQQVCFTNQISNVHDIFLSIKETCSLMNKERYDLIHTHTPIASVCARIAFHKSNIYQTAKLIYTAHGFHFFKGNGVIKNIIFRTVEQYIAHYTDRLITINQEDYAAAKKFHFRDGGKAEYIPGVGIDLHKIKEVSGDHSLFCDELGVPANAKILVSVGELNDNKNHITILKCLPNLPENVHYVICGQGELHDEYLRLAEELGVRDRLHLLGFRTDIIRILKSSDAFVFPSKREGLSVSLMEAIASGIPCIASNIRGNTDLIEEYGGILVLSNSTEEWLDKINDALLEKPQIPAVTNCESLDRSFIAEKIKKIYEDLIKQS